MLAEMRSKGKLPALDANVATICSLTGALESHRRVSKRGGLPMQIGTGNLSLLKGLDAAVEFRTRVGPDRVQTRIMALADRLRAGLRQIPQVTIWSPQHAALTSGTTVWSLQSYTAVEPMDALWARWKVRVRAMGEPLGVRQCCHLWNSPEEVDRTLTAVQQLVAARRV